mgnify:CR=1 FL=1
MRRHARVHTGPGGKEKEGIDTNDELPVDQGEEDSGLRVPANSSKWDKRRGSIASSTSSTVSRRSRDESSDDEHVFERPEKRTRYLTNRP